MTLIPLTLGLANSVSTAGHRREKCDFARPCNPRIRAHVALVDRAAHDVWIFESIGVALALTENPAKFRVFQVFHSCAGTNRDVNNTSSEGNGPAITYIKYLVVGAPAGRSLPASGSLCKPGVYRRRPRPTPGPFSSSYLRPSKQPAPINFRQAAHA